MSFYVDEDLDCVFKLSPDRTVFYTEEGRGVYLIPDKNGISARDKRSGEYTYHFYPSITVPKLGDKWDGHYYHIPEHMVDKTPGQKYSLNNHFDDENVCLTEAYCMLDKVLKYLDYQQDEWDKHFADEILNPEEIKRLMKKMLYHLDKDKPKIKESLDKL